MASDKDEVFALEGGDSKVQTKRPKSSRNILLYIAAGAFVIALSTLVLGLYFGLSTEKTSIKQRLMIKDSLCKRGTEFAEYSVATDTDICSAIGCRVLHKGGSAVDAAVASMFCIGVVTLHSSGIGGGAFILIYEKQNNKTVFINARETAPGAASKDMYVNKSKTSTVGPLSAGVPGEVKGMMEAHKRYGKLEWSQLVQPSIDLASKGFNVTSALESAIKREIEKITDPEFRALLTDEHGNPKKKGDVIINEKFAKTLKEIQKDPDSFYIGKLAKKIAADFQNNGGLITEEDLKKYSAKVTSDILRLDVNDLTMLSCPSPSGGPVVTQIFNILRNYNFNSASIAGLDNTVLTYHRIIEAFKFAYARRPHLGDPDFVKLDKVMEEVMDVEFNKEIYKKISDFTTHNVSYYSPSSYVNDDGSTSHLSVLAPNGDAVSVTGTINFYFGGKFRSNVTGIIYNNEMDDFSTPNATNFFGYPPSENNFITPGKRPLSSMSPTIFVDRKTGDVKLALGAAGGSRIITSTAWVAMHNLWMGLSLEEAISKPRLHHQLFGSNVSIDGAEGYKISQEVQEGLERKGHVFDGKGLSVVQAVGFDKKERAVFGFSDPRKGGSAWGR